MTATQDQTKTMRGTKLISILGIVHPLLLLPLVLNQMKTSTVVIKPYLIGYYIRLPGHRLKVLLTTWLMPFKLRFPLPD